MTKHDKKKNADRKHAVSDEVALEYETNGSEGETWGAGSGGGGNGGMGTSPGLDAKGLDKIVGGTRK